MSTYRLKCSDCGNVFDVQVTLQQYEEEGAGHFPCPKCHSENATQEFSVANFFKNVFRSDGESGGCCSGKSSCDINCAPDKKEVEGKDICCAPKKEGGKCCG